MRLDEIVIYKGCPHLVRGLQPMSVPDPRVQIEDPASGERRWVPLGELHQAEGEPLRRPINRGPMGERRCA
jgi:hypothetical protein